MKSNHYPVVHSAVKIRNQSIVSTRECGSYPGASVLFTGSARMDNLAHMADVQGRNRSKSPKAQSDSQRSAKAARQGSA